MSLVQSSVVTIGVGIVLACSQYWVGSQVDKAIFISLIVLQIHRLVVLHCGYAHIDRGRLLSIIF